VFTSARPFSVDQLGHVTAGRLFRGPEVIELATERTDGKSGSHGRDRLTKGRYGDREP
jgi:hypothetical protein